MTGERHSFWRITGSSSLWHEHIAQARPVKTADGWAVDVHLSADGSQRLSELTSRVSSTPSFASGRVAIVTDGHADSPVLEGPVELKGLRIATGLTERDAHVLALSLRSGALPVELHRARTEEI